MKSWIKSPWGISIGTAIFSLLLTISYDYLKEKPILSTLGSIISWIWSLLLMILTFNVKVWWLILFAGIFILILNLLYKFKNEEASKPDFYNYREGKFKLWKWTWDWKLNDSKNAWIISNMKAHCPKCDTPLIDNSSYYGLKFDCPRCDFIANDFQCDEPHKIERIILDNIERKERDYKK